MVKVNYQLKSGFVSKPTSLVIEESAVSPEDYALMQQHAHVLMGQSILTLGKATIYTGFGSPSVNKQEYVSETLLEANQIIQILKDYLAETDSLVKNLPSLIAQHKEQQEAKKLAEAEAKRIADEQKAITYAAKLETAAQIEWSAEGKAILNLHNRLAILSEVEMDSRFTNWIKRVDKVNKAAENGYCFEGTWVNDKTVEISNENAVFIVAGTSGSRKYAITNYRVIVLRDGKLQATDIKANNSDAGWVLLIRDKVAALL